MEIPHVRTSTYGLPFFRYYAPHAWNDLDIRKSDTLATFKRNMINAISLTIFVIALCVCFVLFLYFLYFLFLFGLLYIL